MGWVEAHARFIAAGKEASQAAREALTDIAQTLVLLENEEPTRKKMSDDLFRICISASRVCDKIDMLISEGHYMKANEEVKNDQ